MNKTDACELEIHIIDAYNLEISKIDAYNQNVHKIDAYIFGDSQNRCVPKSSVNSCVQPRDPTKSWMRAGSSQNSVRFAESQTICGRSFKCRVAVVKTVVEDPMYDDKIPVESGAEVTPVPPDPSEWRT